MSKIQHFKGKVFVRDNSEDYKIHAYQYATTSFPMENINPALIVYVENEDDIKLAIEYARQNNIGVAVRSGGHQYLGASSTGGDNIQIDLSGRESNDQQNYPFRQWVINEAECSLTLGAGLCLSDINPLCLEKGIFFPHGECSTVHIGGHTQTGGWGIIARTFGVMIDHLLSFDIILADGTKRTVNRNSQDDLDKDLWFAVLGGSPGNFGVVTNVTVRYMKDYDYPKARGIKLAWPLKKETVGQLLQIINEINDDPTIDPDFNLTVIAISAEQSMGESPVDPTFDDYMTTNYSHLVGETNFHWHLPLVWVVGCWANSKGVDQDDSQVDSVFDRFRSVPGMIPPAMIRPLLKEDTLMDGNTPTPISRIMHNLTWENPRVLNLSYLKLIWLSNNTESLSQKTKLNVTLAEWVAQKIEAIEDINGPLKQAGIKFAAQIGLIGGPGVANPEIKTGLTQRDGNYLFGFQIFYDPKITNSMEKAKAFANAMALDIVTNNVNLWNDGKERRMIHGPMLINDEKPIMDNQWPLYYANQEDYDRLLQIKHKIDPTHIFTANLFCVGASKCSRF